MIFLPSIPSERLLGSFVVRQPMKLSVLPWYMFSKCLISSAKICCLSQEKEDKVEEEGKKVLPNIKPYYTPGELSNMNILVK